jgi:hypothetical protein
MPLAVWQTTIADELGNVQDGASVEVLLESNGALAALFSDRDGTSPIANPVTTEEDGLVRFYAAGNSYRIHATLGSFERTWRHVAIGLLSEHDIVTETLIRYERTAAEIAANVTPTNYFYRPGDVRRYGAVGNGEDNCAPAFQDAIDQSNHVTGSEVFIPQGSWLIRSSLTGVRGLKMTGEGRYRSIVIVFGAINFLAFTGTLGNPDGGSMVFRDFTIKGSAGSGNLIDLATAGQNEFQGMQFWLGGSDGGMVVLQDECHRTSFNNCLFRSWKNAAILCSGLNSVISVRNCEFNILGADGITQGAVSAAIMLDDGEEITIESCNVNADLTLAHFVRITGSLGNSRIAQCYTERVAGSSIKNDNTGLRINGFRIENCNLSCADSVSIDLAAGNAAHEGLLVKNIRRSETGSVFILDPGTGVVTFDYDGTVLDGSAGHVVGYTGQKHVRKFADGTHYVGSRVRHVIGPWTRDNVAGTVGSTELTGTRWIALRAGRVTGIVVKSTVARTAGTLTVNVFKNTGLSGAAGSVLSDAPSADLDGTNTSFDTGYTQDHDASFAAGDEIYVTYQTSGFTPTTADIRVFVEIEM